MTLYSAGYPAIAMQSEMQIPAEKLIESLKERFKKILYFMIMIMIKQPIQDR